MPETYPQRCGKLIYFSTYYNILVENSFGNPLCATSLTGTCRKH